MEKRESGWTAKNFRGWEIKKKEENFLISAAETLSAK